VAYPGWRAWVEGVATPLETEGSLLRAVDLPAGPVMVILSFQPPTVYLGAALSVLGLVGLGALLWRGRRERW
jgi:uncharacterized membrane protein YfhO